MKWETWEVAIWCSMVTLLTVVIIGACGFYARPDIRTFSGVHTLVYKDTLWRLEPVELDKAGVRFEVDSSGFCQHADSVYRNR